MQIQKLGIIIGGGNIPKMLIEDCKKNNLPFYVLAVKDNADETLLDGSFEADVVRIGQVGTGLMMLKKHNVSHALMIGTIKRPSLKALMPDMRTAALIAKFASKSLGDDGILKILLNEIENNGITLVGVHDVMPSILAPKGVLGKVVPSKQNMIDIKRAVDVIKQLGKSDVGQAAIVQEGLVLSVEAIEGTDELIKRTAQYKRKGSGGVLVKLKKEQQDMRLDLPTIGENTVQNAKNSNLDGVVVHAKNSLIVNQQETIKLADQLGLFVMGVDPDEEN
jgi:DUF1009 family protein